MKKGKSEEREINNPFLRIVKKLKKLFFKRKKRSRGYTEKEEKEIKQKLKHMGYFK